MPSLLKYNYTRKCLKRNLANVDLGRENHRVRYLGLDPGGTTGCAELWLEPTYGEDRHIRPAEEWIPHWTFCQIGPDEHHGDLWNYLTVLAPRDGIACEHFEWRPNRHQNAEYGDRYVELISREYEGIVKLAHDVLGYPLWIQTASQAKSFVKDDNIKNLGLWQPGQKHAMDALRHLLYRLTLKDDIAGIRLELLRKGWK
jgi:hypothetical protein